MRPFGRVYFRIAKRVRLEGGRKLGSFSRTLTRVVKRFAKRFKQFGNLWRRSLSITKKSALRTVSWTQDIVRRTHRSVQRQFCNLKISGGIRRMPETIGQIALGYATRESRASLVDFLLKAPVIVQTSHGPIKFLSHSVNCVTRAETFMVKEPATLQWIDRMEPGSIFWDIGGNVGTLTLYAARREALDIWSFEPAAANYYNLVANAELNGYSDKVKCLQLGFSDCTEIANLNVSQFMVGASFGFSDRKEKRLLRKKDVSTWQAVPVWSIDDFIEHYRIPCPNYIKIDVPGLAAKILEGASNTLLRPEVKQIQIKIASQHGKKGTHVVQILKTCGFEIAYHNLKYRKTGGTVFAVQRDLVFEKTA